MVLIMEVMSPGAEMLGADSRHVFDTDWSTIGRHADNSWVLPDKTVSGRHAAVSCRDGAFYIEDTDSRNGVFLNTVDNQLPPNEPCRLTTGDTVLIEPYRIRVTIAADEHSSDPFRVLRDAVPDAERPPLERAEGPALREERDPLIAMDLGPRPDSRPARDPFQLHNHDPLDEQFTPPPVALGEEERAADPSPDDDHPEPSDAVDRSAMKPALVGAGGGDLAAVLAGAGLSGASVTPELARDLGRILRVVVTGVIDLLHTRQDFKAEFRMDQTRLQRARNNPLKYSADVEDALHNLLVKRSSRYLGPVDAFTDAFDDLRQHQVAMLAGVRLAFESMLARLDPDRLEAEYDRTGRSGVAKVLAKGHYWDQYRRTVQEMAQDPDATFEALFGRKFVEAYEEQLRRIKSGR